MIRPELKKKILEDLNKLPEEKQKRVQEFTHALLISKPKNKNGKGILNLAGIMNDKDAEDMIKVIEEGCEQVDLNEW